MPPEALATEVYLDPEEPTPTLPQPTGTPRRPAGRPAPSPAEVAQQTGDVLAQRASEWLGRLTTDPATFAAVEREVHDQARHQADLYVAGLLAQASQQPELAGPVHTVIGAAEVPLRPVEKKTTVANLGREKPLSRGKSPSPPGNRSDWA